MSDAKRPTGKTPRVRKAKPQLFKLRKDLSKFLREEARRNNLDMTEQLERWIEDARRFKPKAA